MITTACRLASSLLLLLLATAPATAQIDRLVDENGKVLFTNAPSSAPKPPLRNTALAATWREAFGEGVQALRDRSLGESIRWFRRAIEVDPDARAPYLAIRSAYGQMGRDSLAAAADGVLLAKARKALANDDVAGARRIVGKMLDEHFANPTVHSVVQAIRERNGDREGAEHARKVSRGLLDAILTTGDGLTPGTAFRVQSISEEYLIVSVLGCTRTRQVLHTAPSGRLYDLLTVSCDGQERLVHFDISAFLSAEPRDRLQAYRYDPDSARQ
jgi:hypothetical protein